MSEKVRLKDIIDIYPEMPKYLKHIKEMCGGETKFYCMYLDDKIFSLLADLHETITRTVLTRYKLECGQVVIHDMPLEGLLDDYITRIDKQIINIKKKRKKEKRG